MNYVFVKLGGGAHPQDGGWGLEELQAVSKGTQSCFDRLNDSSLAMKNNSRTSFKFAVQTGYYHVLSRVGGFV
jgi:hypothetical protein